MLTYVKYARRLANDAATSDVPSIKQTSLTHCKEQLEAFRTALLLASHTNLVDTVDVAQLSAMADEVADLVKRREHGLQ
jgi:isopropylmalate/homocitrate/citramalate synthase